ncbi:radical SAM-linked protein [[Clostridium] aminophilum]|uniref:Radical SAM-linked protein n=1 Tax=[Clostridium] aminophilum TaxID=1526 RepID=A0A1I6IKL4_9FIRM|nr:TIGR03936 family radical SAM-associated protein [[Clostridium] aminophilum]SFR67246.1 radical SAM-linked protein [[Clostridium] aminophilum]
MKIRIKFRKQGFVRFVGHLDLMRTYQKTMKRADVAIKYSGGFSPHQIMSFASPLSVGMISNGEYMDIEVEHCGTSAEMVEQVNSCVPEGMDILSWRQLDDNTKNAMSQVAFADYKVWFKEGSAPESEEEFWAGFGRFVEQDHIPYVKKTKKGEKELDLRERILEARPTTPLGIMAVMFGDAKIGDFDRVLISDPSERSGYFLRLASGSAANTKPEQVLEAYCASIGMEYPKFDIQVEREELYANVGTEEAPVLKSLEDFGKEIR